MFVNVPDADQIAVIDRTAMKVMATWPVVGARANFPMALDEANHRMFVGCRRPAKVLVYDTTTGKESGSFDIVGDTDDLFYDATRKRLYVSGGEGYLDVFQEQEPTALFASPDIATAAGARTSLFVPESERASTLRFRTGAARRPKFASMRRVDVTSTVGSKLPPSRGERFCARFSREE